MIKSLKSLHLRLVGTYLALALLLLTITGLVFSRAFITYADRVHRIRYAERTLQAQEIARESQGSIEETVRLLQESFPDLEFAVIRLGAGFANTTRTQISPESPLPEPRLFVRQSGEAEPSRIVLGSSPTRGTAILVQPKRRSTPLFSALYREVAVVLAAALALAFLVGWSFSRWLARPVAVLAEATTAVAGGDFLQQVPLTGTPELDRLAEQFNRMVARLDESFRSLAAERDLAQRFAADAAHELKTPLTALRAYYELAATSPERTGQVLEPLGRQIDRLQGIMAGLLQLARLSEGTGVQLSTGDVRAAVLPLVTSFRVLAEEYGHHFRLLTVEQPLPVREDPRLVELILTNLIENACKFTPPGGEVTLTIRADGTDAAITVADTGPGIPPDELPHIFDRFHRGIGTQEIPGSGLGLSIVQEATRRLGGSLTVESQAGQGSAFTVRLPLHPPSQEV